MPKLNKAFMLSIMISMMATGCGNGDNAVTERPISPSQGLNSAIPSVEAEKTLQQDAVFLIDSNVYLYDHQSLNISLIGVSDEVVQPQVSPNNSLIAVQSKQMPGVAEPTLIYDRQTHTTRAIDVRLQDPNIGSVKEISWLNDDKLLLGADYNSYVRGYFVYEINTNKFTTTKPLLTKVASRVIVSIDENGDHFIYQSANERSNGALNPPALLLDDTVVFFSDSDQSVIGGILVHPAKTEVAFPLSNSKESAMLIVSGIDRAGAKLTNMNKYILGLPEEESVLEYTFDFSTDKGYLYTNSTNGGDIKLYAVDVSKQPATTYITAIESVDELGSLSYEDGELYMSIREEKRYRFNFSQLRFENVENNKTEKQLLIARIQEQLPQDNQPDRWEDIQHLKLL